MFPSNGPADDAVAVIEVNEQLRRQFITWAQLRERVRQCSLALKANGVVGGDRVAGYVSNSSNTLVAMLSATAIGAIWSGISPENGPAIVLDRLQQIHPSLLFADNAAIYNGKVHSLRQNLQTISSGLTGLKIIVIFESVPSSAFHVDELAAVGRKSWGFNDFISTGSDLPMTFEYLPAESPVYILFSRSL